MTDSNLDKAQRLLDRVLYSIVNRYGGNPDSLARARTELARGYIELETARTAQETPEPTAQEKSEDAALRELSAINQALRNAGFEYPTGVRGVRDLIRMWGGLTGELPPFADMVNENTTPPVVRNPEASSRGTPTFTYGPGQVVQDSQDDYWYVCGYAGAQTLLSEAVREDVEQFRVSENADLAYTWDNIKRRYGPLTYTGHTIHGFDLPQAKG